MSLPQKLLSNRLRPLARGVDDGENVDFIVFEAVGHNVGVMGNDKLARFFASARPSGVGLFHQCQRLVADMRYNAASSLGVFAGMCSKILAMQSRALGV